MSYNKTTWKNRLVERPQTYSFRQNADGTVTLILAEGEVIEAGTPVNAENMNKIENAIEELFTVAPIGENISQLLQSSGYRKLPGGLILQWGNYTTPQGGVNGSQRGIYYKTVVGLKFPIAFSKKVCSLNVVCNNALCWAYAADNHTLDTFSLGCSNMINAETNVNKTLFWIAIGY